MNLISCVVSIKDVSLVDSDKILLYENNTFMYEKTVAVTFKYLTDSKIVIKSNIFN